MVADIKCLPLLLYQIFLEKSKTLLDKTPFMCYNKEKTKEVIAMAKKQKKLDRRVFKKEGEELQQWLAFRKRGSKVENGKAYNRQKMKKEGRGEWDLLSLASRV